MVTIKSDHEVQLMREAGQILAKVHMELSKNRKIDISVNIHTVSLLVDTRSGIGSDTTVIAHLESPAIDIERDGKLRILAAHGNVEPVVAMHHCLILLTKRIFLASLHILQIDKILARGAR